MDFLGYSRQPSDGANALHRCTKCFLRCEAASRHRDFVNHSAAHYLPAALVARIYGVLPLTCPNCGGKMRIIVFITLSADVQKILDHIRVESAAPCITLALIAAVG